MKHCSCSDIYSFLPVLKLVLSSSLHRHWLTSSYIMFAVPYFVYDIYAMFMCYWYKLRVKGHEEASAAPQHMRSALTSYLRREFLMVLHHVVMVTVCFPVSVVTVTNCSFCFGWDLSEASGKHSTKWFMCKYSLWSSFYNVERTMWFWGNWTRFFLSLSRVRQNKCLKCAVWRWGVVQLTWL